MNLTNGGHTIQDQGGANARFVRRRDLESDAELPVASTNESRSRTK